MKEDLRYDRLKNVKSINPKREGATVNTKIWIIEYIGRSGTVWENGIYKARLEFGPEYPE